MSLPFEIQFLEVMPNSDWRKIWKWLTKNINDEHWDWTRTSGRLDGIKFRDEESITVFTLVHGNDYMFKRKELG